MSVGCCNPSARGFTLASALVSIAIVAMLGGIVLVGFGTARSDAELAAAAETLAALLRDARGRAVHGVQRRVCEGGADQELNCGEDLHCRAGTCGMSVPAFGYGVQLYLDDPSRAYLFQDANGDGATPMYPSGVFARNGIRPGIFGDGDDINGTEYIEFLVIPPGTAPVAVTSLIPATPPGSSASAVFLPMDGSVAINSDVVAPSLTVVLTHARTGKSIGVRLNRVAGTIEIIKP